MKRKWSIIVAVVLIAFLIGALLAHLFLLPSLAQRQAESMAKDRGVLLDMGKVSVFGTTLEFEDVVVCSKDCGTDDPMVVTVDHMKVTPDFWSVLTGSPRPSRIMVSGARVRLDVTSPAILDLLRVSQDPVAGEEAVDVSDSHAVGAKGFGDLPRMVASDIKVEITIAEGTHLSFDDATLAVESRGGVPAVDLGATSFQSPLMDVEARHLIVDLAPPGEPGPVRALRFVEPVIVLEPALLKKESPIEQSDDAPLADESEDAEVNPILGVLAMIDDGLTMTAMPDMLLEIFPKPRVEINDGSIHVPSTDSSSAVDAAKIRGHVTVDEPGSSMSMEIEGEIHQGPFLLTGSVDGQRILLDVDTPYVPIGLLTPHLPIPGSMMLEDARCMLNAEVRLDRTSGLITVDGTVAGDSITIESDRVALEPVKNVHFRVDGHLELDPNEMTLVMNSSELDACGIPLNIGEGRIARLDNGYKITLRGNMPNTRCQELFNSLPFAMRSSLPGFLLDGDLGAQFNLDMDWNNPDDAVLDVNVDNQCRVVSGGDLKLSKFSGTFVHNVKDKVGEHAFVMGPGSDSWSNLEEIAEHMPHALVTCEDGAFYKHKGISEFAIKRAVKRNIKKGYFALGASTITMQLVKNLLLTRDKTISRKLQEMILTWWIENNLEKDQIMELYLNVVEYGPKLYGIKAASELYFGKLPIHLSLLESAHLAKMLPNPVSRYRYYKNGKNGVDPKWISVLKRVVTKMFERGYITKEEWDEAMAEEFHFYYPGMEYFSPQPTAEDVEPASEPQPEAEVIPSLPDTVYVPASSPFPDFSAN